MLNEEILNENELFKEMLNEKSFNILTLSKFLCSFAF